MESFGARPLAAIAAAKKIVYWSFIVTDALSNTYYWSTGAIPSTGTGVFQAHTFKIVNFSGITLRRNKSESGIHAANDASFTISNKSNALTASNFTGGSVLISLLINDGIGKELCGSWKFRIKTASPYDQQIDVECEDFVQEFLRGTYPNTPLVDSIFPTVEGTGNDNVCVPEPYGTCYIPLRSVYAGTARYYLLGDTTNTYTIEEVRSPRQLGTKIVWTSAGFTFAQSTVADAASNDWRVFQPLIAGGYSGIFVSGSKILDVPTKFSRSDTASLTNPADIIHRVLNNMGAVDGDLDLDSFTAAADTIRGYGTDPGFLTDDASDGFLTDDASDGFLTEQGITSTPSAWNFAFWYKEDRAVVLSRLLAMCHCCLIVGEKIRLQVLSKTSQKTITQAEVLKMDDVGQDTFKYADSLQIGVSDSGYVAFQQAGESQDEFMKIIVPAKASTNVIDGEVITFPGLTDTEQVQRFGTLYYQRKFSKAADITATLKGTCLALRPDDVITVNHADYGGSYPVLIDEMTIGADVSVGISAIRFSVALDDFADLSPGAVTVATNVPTTAFSPVLSGPDSSPSTGAPPNVMPGRLRLSATDDYIVLDPADPQRISMYGAGVEILRMGNLNGFLDYVTDVYGIAFGNATNYLKSDATNGLRASGSIAASTIDIGGSDASSFHVDVAGNMWLGAATLATAPFSVTAAGVVNSTAATANMEQGFAEPGDEVGVGTPGTGIKITGGNIKAYGTDQTFGGTVISSDGNYMSCTGKYLTATGLTKQRPRNNSTNFADDGKLHIYYWNGSAWVLVCSFGYNSSSDAMATIEAAGVENYGLMVTGGSNGAILGANSGANLTALIGSAPDGTGVEGNGLYGGQFIGAHVFDGSPTGAPVRISPAGAGAPTHSALMGSLWVDNAGILYINTSNSTTWAKVGAQ